ncbi:hypothetical protein [endosymbiont of unidentified scaly snail isolate Monju]|uniref:hypothetical protein n=1 Tax=endosymbiont of unidentified scaly snail isolate Monju TaxID=1248727 RepID=UPI0005BD3B98|nr:hypothetical protein [endosymbiont of unidentified scaly snail isolate Monju]
MRIASLQTALYRPLPTGARRPVEQVAPAEAAGRAGSGQERATSQLPVTRLQAGLREMSFQENRSTGLVHRALSAYGAVAGAEQRQAINEMLGVSVWA